MTEVSYELAEMVQEAFDKYILEKIPELLEKHFALMDEVFLNRIKQCASPAVNKEVYERVNAIVDTTVGNYLRVGDGRNIVDRTVSQYLDKKLEEHIEHQVQWRLNRLMEKLKKDFEKTMTPEVANGAK